MRRLDQDGDGKLSFSEFYDAVNLSRPLIKTPQISYSYYRSSPSPSLRVRNYSPPEVKTARPILYSSTLATRTSLYESPPRASLYESSLRGRDINSGRGSGLTHPNEYSPLRGAIQITREHPSKVQKMEEPPMQSPSFGQTQEETKEEKVEMTENIGPMRVEENEAEGPSGGEEYEDKQNDEGETPSNQVEEAEPRQDEKQEEEAIPQEEEGGDQPVEVNIEV